MHYLEFFDVQSVCCSWLLKCRYQWRLCIVGFISLFVIGNCPK